MGLREILPSRGLPETTYPIRAVTSAVLADAEAELSAARTALAVAEGAKRVSTAHRDRVSAAEDAVAACYHVLTVRALPPAEYEALVAEHAPGDDADGKRRMAFNQATLMPALLAVCVFDGPDEAEPALSEGEWREQIAKGSGSAGETGALFATVWAINDRSPDVNIPKGSTQTHNSHSS
jgi:hypothetical protein